MKYIIRLIYILLSLSPLRAENEIIQKHIAPNKHIILSQGGSWGPLLAENLIENHKYIESLPFSGLMIVGNSFTTDTMKIGETLTHGWLWKEMHGLKNLYKNKPESFLRINLGFPGDFWDDKVWNRVAKNFGMVARVAREIGVKGIAIDDEGYGSLNKRVVNFKFPTKDEIKASPKKYKYWEKKGSNYSWVDRYSYRNPKYTFKEHMDKLKSRFKEIMIEMQKEENYPNLTVLVYFGPSLSHANINKEKLIMSYRNRARQHEYKGPLFLGLKDGLKGKSTLYDMGENYRYRKDRHFKDSYSFRKYKIATNEYNDKLNPAYQWRVPRKDRLSWSSKVQVGFMVYNKGEESPYPEFDTRDNSSISDIKYSLQKALKYSDKYVIYYCQGQNWLEKNRENFISKKWIDMMKEVGNQK